LQQKILHPPKLQQGVPRDRSKHLLCLKFGGQHSLLTEGPKYVNAIMHKVQRAKTILKTENKMSKNKLIVLHFYKTLYRVKYRTIILQTSYFKTYKERTSKYVNKNKCVGNRIAKSKILLQPKNVQNRAINLKA
jgi:hypothetical protein